MRCAGMITVLSYERRSALFTPGSRGVSYRLLKVYGRYSKAGLNIVSGIAIERYWPPRKRSQAKQEMTAAVTVAPPKAA